MKATIIREDEWHQDISEQYACHLIGCKKWQLESAINDSHELMGWRIREVIECRRMK